MTWLLDANVLVALMLEDHVHHKPAVKWFDSHQDSIAFCAVTQGAFLRIHMILATDHSAAAAWATLSLIERHPRHKYWDDGFGYAKVDPRSIQGPKQVTDAWLAELARRRSGKLATFDEGLSLLHRDVAVRIKA